MSVCVFLCSGDNETMFKCNVYYKSSQANGNNVNCKACQVNGNNVNGGQHYVPRFLCSHVPMFPEPMFPGTYVPRYLCSPVPMFPDFFTLIVDFSINR